MKVSGEIWGVQKKCPIPSSKLLIAEMQKIRLVDGRKWSILTAGEACEVEEHQDSVFSPPLSSFVLRVLMTFHQHEALGRSCHSCCQISQNNSDTPAAAAAAAQSLWWESALSLQTHISNLDTCAHYLIFPLTVEWKKVLSVCGGSRDALDRWFLTAVH